MKKKALTGSAEREGWKKRIAEMREFLNNQTTDVSEYDEQLVWRLIEKVTVYNEGGWSGIQIWNKCECGEITK